MDPRKRGVVTVTLDTTSQAAVMTDVTDVRFSFRDVTVQVSNAQMMNARDPGTALAHVRDMVKDQIAANIDGTFDRLFADRGEPHHTRDGERDAERRRMMDGPFREFLRDEPVLKDIPRREAVREDLLPDFATTPVMDGESPLAALDRLVCEVTRLAAPR
jgi:hypothetical protein